MQVGIILPHLIPSQLGFEVVNLVNSNPNKHSYTIFYEDLMPNLLSPTCPVMNISDVKYFRTGRIVCFSLSSASLLLKSVNHIEPILYLYDLPWLRGHADYMENLKIMRALPVYTRSDEYARLASNYANIKCVHRELREVLCP